MTKREIAALAYKMAGLFALFQSAVLLPLLGTIVQALSLGSLQPGMMVLMAVVWVTPFLGLVIGGVVLVKRSEYFAAKTFGGSDVPLQSQICAEEVIRIAQIMLGLSLICYALPDLVSTSAAPVLRQMVFGAGDGDVPMSPESLAGIMGLVFQLALGGFLLVERRLITSIWYRLRGREINDDTV
jgi:hypothetical protein